MDDLHQPIGRGNEVGVEDGDEFALGDVQAFFKRAGFEAMAVFAMDVNDGVTEGGVAVDDLLGDVLGFVGGVVENLDF